MKVDIRYQPAYSLAICYLSQGESLQAEAGAMVSHSAGITLKTEMRGGLFSALKRSVLGGESFFINTFVAEADGEVTLAPSLPGDITLIPMNGGTILVQSGSYLASQPSIQIDTAWGGAKSFFSSEGLFLLRATGSGSLLVSSYGAIHQIDLKPKQRYTVDTGHMVAFEDTVQYSVRTAGGLKATLFGGEGLVCDYIGPGRLWIQTRSEDSFLKWLLPRLPKS